MLLRLAVAKNAIHSAVTVPLDRRAALGSAAPARGDVGLQDGGGPAAQVRSAAPPSPPAAPLAQAERRRPKQLRPAYIRKDNIWCSPRRTC